MEWLLDSKSAMEMLNPPHSSATVVALTEARIWRLTRDELRGFMEARPEAGRRLMKLLARTFAGRVGEDGMES